MLPTVHVDADRNGSGRVAIIAVETEFSDMSLDLLPVALVQMCSTVSHQDNIAWLNTVVSDIPPGSLLALPENAGLMNSDFAAIRLVATTEDRDPFIAACRALAARHGLWIHIGSTPISDGRKLRNHSVLIDEMGQMVARYDKIHMFDIHLQGQRPIRESSRYVAGDVSVIADTPWGPWGLSICYDLRFPHLYRLQAKAGARVLFVPSAFLVATGRAHWEVLLRARAIENGAWVVAAAQVGHHDDGRTSYGHSLIVDPWGRVVVDLGGKETGCTTTVLDLGDADRARSQIPSLSHDRQYGLARHPRDPGPAPVSTRRPTF